MTLSVLAKARKADIRRDPYPHIVIENALDADLFDALEASFPPVALVTGGAALINAKKGINIDAILASDSLAPIWKSFAAYHGSAEFYAEFAALFGDEIRRLYPDLERTIGQPLESFRPRHRAERNRRAMHRNDEFVLDFQIMFDDTRDPRICRGPHVDDPAELFACLLYFPHTDDDSNGGNLYVVRPKPDAARWMLPAERIIRVRRNPAEVDTADVDLVTTIPYRRNTAIIFLNSERSLHAVTERPASTIPRRHVNIIGESYALPAGLFRITVDDPDTRRSGLRRARETFSRAAKRLWPFPNRQEA
jgi:hypothetical protein